MQSTVRCIFLSQLHRAQIADNQRIYANRIQKTKILRQRHHIPIAGQNIAGNIQLFPGGMGQLRSPPQSVKVKVGTAHTHTVGLTGHIDGIGAKTQRRPQPFFISGRR